jgi:signal transduction histidine kinase/ActR/RegA family two-component response regulator
MDQRSKTTMKTDKKPDSNLQNLHSGVSRDQLRSAQINLIYSQTLLGGFAAWLGGAVLAGALWNWVGHVLLITWISCYAAIVISRLFLVRAFRRAAPSGEKLFPWGRRHAILTFLSALFWTFAAVFMFPEQSEHLQIFMIIFVGGVVSGAVVIYSPTNEYLINIALVLVPLSVRFFYQGGDFHPMVGGILLMFGAFMAILGRGVHKLYSELLTLRLEKDNLVENLREEISSRNEALAISLKLRDEAEAASATKSEFLTNMSHELRTPLTAVIGFSDLLGDQLFGKLNEKQSGYVAEISSAGRHLLRLINDILDLAKVESGKMDISLSPVDLPELLGHCLVMIRETAMKRGLAVDLKVSEQIDGKIQADDVRLKQIVMNLLSNAAKFTPSGGTIRLAAEILGKEILVSVSDTGVGLKPDDQKRIFQPFEQLDSSFSRQEQGTGLGLALVRKLVELHGGRVWVESEGEGMGSNFKFVFPFIQAEKDMDSQLGPELVNFPSLTLPDFSDEEKNHPTVLVVEDNESNMKFTTDLLEAAHYKAIHAFSAEEAIKIAETENPALILMDVSLPGMDGLEATQILKRNTATSHIPVIALTAHAMKDNENSAKLAGCDAYILKPVDTKIFYHTLVSLIHSGKENPSL